MTESFLDVSRSLGLTAVWLQAGKCAFYKGIIRDFPSIDFERLARFPITKKSDLREKPEAFCPGSKFPDYIQFSGGKSGPPALLFSDANWMSDVYEDFEESYIANSPRPILLKSAGASQGNAPIIPGRVGALSIPFRTRENYLLATSLVERKFTFDGYQDHISTLMLPLPIIKKFIYFLIEQGHDTKNMKISKIYCYSHFLSQKWRAKIESFWNCELVNVYGITELRAAQASSCPHCGFLHFNDKVIAEVVDATSNKRIKSGRGKLLLTTLSTDRYTSPILIRYDTDDIVDLGPHCEFYGEPGIKPLGKLRDFLSEGPSIAPMLDLSPADVIEQLDTDPMVARTEPVRFSGITSTHDDASPKWNWKLHDEGGKTRVKISVEIKYEPELFAESYNAWRSRIREGLRGAVEKARSNKNNIEIDICGVGPGKLGEQTVIF